MESSSSLDNKSEPRRPRKPKTICLPFEEAEYQRCLDDHGYCRQYIMERYECFPELFPAALSEGFTFHGFLSSKKQDLIQRRIKLKANDEPYQIRPSFMMPYMIGPTQEVEKALYYRTLENACLYVRAMALVWNFHPYGQKTQRKYGARASPFQQLNGFAYHDNGLENMMIAASLNGQRA